MTTLVVIDEGSAQTKATYRNPNGEVMTLTIPSRVEQDLKVTLNGL